MVVFLVISYLCFLCLWQSVWDFKWTDYITSGFSVYFTLLCRYPSSSDLLSYFSIYSCHWRL